MSQRAQASARVVAEATPRLRAVTKLRLAVNDKSERFFKGRISGIASFAIGKEYTVLPCYIDRQGRWWSVESVAASNAASLRIEPILGESAVAIRNRRMQVDVIFPVLHGQNGEDGTVQGLARLMHTPVVGCGIDGSVVRMDKILTKQLLENAAIPTVPYVVYIEGDIRPTYKALKQQLGGTLFVKPSRLGSSIGVSKVDSEHGFDEALDTHVSKTVGSVGTAL